MERDEESGLSYHAARYYIPWLGRWMSSDPGGMVDGTNLYCYSKNNPLTLKDTNGKQASATPQTATITSYPFEQRMDPAFGASRTTAGGQLRFAGQTEVMRNEHVLVSPPGSSISSNTGSLLLNRAVLSFSRYNYSVSLNANFLMTTHFLEPGSWETNLDTSVRLTPVFQQQDGQFRLFNVDAQARTMFLGVNFSARVQLQNPPTEENVLELGTNILQSPAQWSTSLQNYIQNTLGGNVTFNASLRFLGLPITYAWGSSNIFNTTNIHALGITLAPAGTLFSVAAPLVGGMTMNTFGSNSFNARGGILPLISPSAISAGEPAIRQFPVYGYASAQYGHSFPGIGTLSVGAEGFINIGETVHPVIPSMDFNTTYDQLHGTYDQRPPAQFNFFLRVQH